MEWIWKEIQRCGGDGYSGGGAEIITKMVARNSDTNAIFGGKINRGG